MESLRGGGASAGQRLNRASPHDKSLLNETAIVLLCGCSLSVRYLLVVKLTQLMNWPTLNSATILTGCMEQMSRAL